MNVSLVMTIVGPDKPAIVDSVAALVMSSGGNWLGSRMMRLGGQFAGILHIRLPAESEEAFRAGVPPLEAKGLKIVIHADQEVRESQGERTIRLSLVGQDRPGIVRQITHALAESGANLEEFESECSSAPMSGETLFKASAIATLPEGCPAEHLRKDLERIAADLMVELAFEN